MSKEPSAEQVKQTLRAVADAVVACVNKFVFEPNNDGTHCKIRAEVAEVLDGMWREGAFKGTAPSEAYFVSCGVGTTMDLSDVQNGSVIVQVGVAVLEATNFITIWIRRLPDEVIFPHPYA